MTGIESDLHVSPPLAISSIPEWYPLSRNRFTYRRTRERRAVERPQCGAIRSRRTSGLSEGRKESVVQCHQRAIVRMIDFCVDIDAMIDLSGLPDCSPPKMSPEYRGVKIGNVVLRQSRVVSVRQRSTNKTIRS